MIFCFNFVEIVLFLMILDCFFAILWFIIYQLLLISIFWFISNYKYEEHPLRLYQIKGHFEYNLRWKHTNFVQYVCVFLNRKKGEKKQKTKFGKFGAIRQISDVFIEFRLLFSHNYAWISHNNYIIILF